MKTTNETIFRIGFAVLMIFLSILYMKNLEDNKRLKEQIDSNHAEISVAVETIKNQLNTRVDTIERYLIDTSQAVKSQLSSSAVQDGYYDEHGHYRTARDGNWYDENGVYHDKNGLELREDGTPDFQKLLNEMNKRNANGGR